LIPKEEQARFLKDLIPIEKGLVYGNAIGEVSEFPFTFEVHDPTPIRHKAIPYAKQER
jgi:hypothetical protein